MLHQKIVDLGRILGYFHNDNGVCNGFTFSIIEALLSDEESMNMLNEIINIIYNIDTDYYLDKSEQLIVLLKEKNQLVTVSCWYDRLAMYQIPERLDNNLTYLDIEKISTFASSKMIEDKGGLEVTYKTSFIYYKVELNNYLNRLGEKLATLSNDGSAIYIPFSLVALNPNHTTAIIYHLPDKKWKWFIDINNAKMKDNEIELTKIVVAEEVRDISSLVEEIFIAFEIDESSPLAFNMALINTKNHATLGWKDELANFDEINGRPITQAVINRKGNATLACTAAAGGNIHLLEKILPNNGFNVNDLHVYDKTMLHLAVEINRPDIVKLLCTHPALEVNSPTCTGRTALFMAVYSGYLAVVKVLLTHPRININLLYPDAKKRILPTLAPLLGHRFIKRLKENLMHIF